MGFSIKVALILSAFFVSFLAQAKEDVKCIKGLCIGEPFVFGLPDLRFDFPKNISSCTEDVRVLHQTLKDDFLIEKFYVDILLADKSDLHNPQYGDVHDMERVTYFEFNENSNQIQREVDAISSAIVNKYGEPWKAFHHEKNSTRKAELVYKFKKNDKEGEMRFIVQYKHHPQNPNGRRYIKITHSVQYDFLHQYHTDTKEKNCSAKSYLD